MYKKRSGFSTALMTSAIVLVFVVLAGVVIVQTGVLKPVSSGGAGLTGLVSVKGTVNVEALNLSENEVKKINRVVNEHKDMFTQINLFLDAKSDRDDITKSTTLVMAMVLETSGDCEVRSWSRKVARGDLVPQMIRYMKRAATEYEEFRKYPDVKQNFKCLYI